MNFTYDGEIHELLARGGTFDLTGTSALIDKQFYGFDASDGAVIASIKGVQVGKVYTTLTQIRAAEVDVSSLLVTSLAAGLTTNFYRVDGYVITSVTLTSGTLHLYKTFDQVSA